jgi:hypothetical protein
MDAAVTTAAPRSGVGTERSAVPNGVASFASGAPILSPGATSRCQALNPCARRRGESEGGSPPLEWVNDDYIRPVTAGDTPDPQSVRSAPGPPVDSEASSARVLACSRARRELERT